MGTFFFLSFFFIYALMNQNVHIDKLTIFLNNLYNLIIVTITPLIYCLLPSLVVVTFSKLLYGCPALSMPNKPTRYLVEGISPFITVLVVFPGTGFKVSAVPWILFTSTMYDFAYLLTIE